MCNGSINPFQMLIWCSRNIFYYYQYWKQLCCLIFWGIHYTSFFFRILGRVVVSPKSIALVQNFQWVAYRLSISIYLSIYIYIINTHTWVSDYTHTLPWMYCSLEMCSGCFGRAWKFCRRKEAVIIHLKASDSVTLKSTAQCLSHPIPQHNE